MIDLSMNFEEMKKKIEFISYVVDEVISPEENPDKFTGFDGLNYLYKNKISIKDARCLSWKYFNKLFRNFSDGTSISSFFNELQYNSFMHGHKWDKTLPVRIKAGYGSRGFVAQIEDCGNGFDYHGAMLNYMDGEKYFTNKGHGFNRFCQDNDYVISWEGKGNISNLMFKVNSRDLDLWDSRILQINKNSNFSINL